MNNKIIATDYENVIRKIKQMESEIEAIENALVKVTEAINNTSEWKGPDAVAYKIILKGYVTKIKNSSRWLKNLDKILSNHAYKLYQRALNDNSAKNFR